MKLAWKIFSVVTLCLIVGTYLSRLEASPATQTESPTTFPVQSSEPFTPASSRPVSSLAPISPDDKIFNREINTILNPHRFSPDLGLTGTDTKSQDPLAPLSKIFTGRTPDPILQFEGLGTDGFAPPDTIGEVGPNHYVQMVNVSFRVFDKTGNPLTADLAFNTLFTGSGLSICENNNDGDPIVVYDELADRWLLSQFALPSGQESMCIAISQTGDPTGAYHLYQFVMPDFPDYFKFGVWTDAYYMTTNTGFPNQYYAYAFDRDNMLAGQPATFQFSNNHPNFMMPADIDGSTPPPANTPGFFYTMLAEGYPDHPAGVDRLRLYEFDVDWDTPGNSTFTIAEEFPIADYNYTVCGFFVGNCIPQTGTAQGLDSLSYWPMWRLPYRNLGSYQAMVGNFTVDLDGTNKAAIRWFELRNTGSGWELHQEGTHAPDAAHRWMGSIAMDGSGNIAMGYSVSSSTTSPSIRYASRLASDPAGTFQTEVNVITSGGSQTGTHRWGDYSALSVDPADDCTFWFTTEYHDATDSGFNWNTRIVAFRLPECTGGLFPDFALQSDPTDLAVCTPANAVYNIDVLSIMDFTDPVDLSLVGNPAGTSVNFSVDPVTPPGSSVLTIGNTGSATAGSYDMSLVGIAPTSTHTITIGLDLYDSAPGTATLTTPADGATGVGNQPTFAWNAVADASNYHLEVAIDPAFSLVVYEADEDGTSHALPTTLTGGVTYYWRVTAENICGDTTSSTFSFTVSDPATICRQPNLPITDNQTTSDSLVIPGGSNITDLNVVVKANHTYVGDTIFTLVHVDTGTSVTMIDRPGRTTTGFGCSGNNIDVILDDEGADGPVENQCAADPALFGSPTPNNPLSAFDGQSLAGTWTLQVSDAAGGDTGTVTEWCLEEPALNGDYNVGVELIGSPQSANAGTAVEYPVVIFNQGAVTDTYDITVDSGWPASVSSTSVTIAPASMQIVTLTVNIPLTEATGAMDLADVTAVSQANASVNGTDTAETHVALGVEFELFAPVTSDGGLVNTDVIYTAYITNTGIAADSYDLSLTNDLGWTVSIDQSSVTLNPGEGAELEVTVSIPSVANGISSSTELYAESQANAGVNDSVNFVTTAEGYEVEVFAPVTAQSTDAGTTVTYTVEITNTGAVDDSFTVSVMSSEGWPASVDPISVTLTAGSTDSVEVMVTVPMTAEGGTDDTTTVTAVSDSAPTVSDSVDLETSVNEPDIQTDATSLEVTLGMTSTATQTFTIMNEGGSALDWSIVEVGAVTSTPQRPSRAVETVTNGTMAVEGFTFSGSTVTGSSVVPAANPVAPNMVMITHSASQTITPLNSVGCNAGGLHTDNGYLRVFDLATFGLADGFDVTEVQVGVETATGTGGSQPVSVRLYALDPADPFTYANLDLIGSTDTTINDTTASMFSVAVEGSVPADMLLVVEFFTPNGQGAGNGFFIGSNNAGQTGPSYIAAADCGATDPTDLADLGFPGMHIVMNVVGEEPACVATDIPWITSITPNSGITMMGESTDVDVVFDSTGYSAGVYTGTVCINNNDPDMSQYMIPVTMTVVENATYGVEVMADTMAMTGTVGTTITYTVWVTNTGNVNDTFDVELSGHTWDTSASHSSISLDPGEMGMMMVMVSVPMTATEGMTDTTMVMVTSQGDDTVSEMMHLTTTAVVPAPAMMYLYLPIINREP